MRTVDDAVAMLGKLTAKSDIVTTACGVCCSSSGGGNGMVMR